MSTSSEGIIFYGFTFFSEEHDWSDCEMSKEMYSHLLAITDEDSEDYAKQGNKRGEVAFGWSGNLTCNSMWRHVYIIGSEIVGSHFPTSFDPANMMTSDVPHWRERLKTFCSLNGIPWEEPGWKLTVKHG